MTGEQSCPSCRGGEDRLIEDDYRVGLGPIEIGLIPSTYYVGNNHKVINKATTKEPAI